MKNIKILSEINSILKEEEEKVQLNINAHLDNFQDFYFDAGAGAGKTYALVESIKHVLKNPPSSFKRQNKKILCITYTNSAKDEIKKQTSFNQSVKVNTIHQFLWSIISRHQNLLLIEHSHTLAAEIKKLKQIISDNQLYKKLQNKEKYNDFSKIIYDKNFMNEFYSARNKKLKEFQEDLSLYFEDTVLQDLNVLSVKLHFQELVESEYKLDRFNKAKEKLLKNKKNKVEYTPRINYDRLERMQISHDTVIKYSYEIINKYDIIKKQLIDIYPYILIDEYQDTQVKVVKILSLLSSYSKNQAVDFIVGYFGDTMQSIYSEGVGNELLEYHSEPERVQKSINRRSTTAILDVANQFRNDGISQKSIFEDSDYGEVEVIIKGDNSNSKNLNKEEVQSFIEEFQQNHLTLPGETHKNICLVSKHELSSQLLGFSNYYRTIVNMPRYSGGGYRDLNTEFLSTNINYLNPVLRIIFELLKLEKIIKSDNKKLTALTSQVHNPV